MERSPLSENERRVLAQMEHALRQDRHFALRMGDHVPVQRPRRRGLPEAMGSGRGLVLLCLLSLALMITGIATAHTPVTVAFAAVWTATLALAAVWLFARSARRRRR
ncbi:DUF3040 domain-containing protein [Streptomyces fructofermentans]|uniref:DUF3040 domain-containing protein n=1 Tax=Streptomyces fructofermentans TaxID=152141 RepID=UPI0033F96B59